MSTEISKEDARKALNELESSHAVQVAKLRAVIDAPEQKGLWGPKRGGLYYSVNSFGVVCMNEANYCGETEKAIDRGSCFPSREIAEKAADRKSTRLNSSHSQISYAVFCLKKK